MKTEYDDRVIEWFPLKNNNVRVKIADHEGVEDNGYSKKNKSQPCPLGAFKLSHSKRLMKDVIIALDGFKNHKRYYLDIGSVYIHKNNYEVLKEQNLIGKDLYESKNKYGDASIVYALFMSAKIKFCRLIDDNGLLQQQITFDGSDREISQTAFKDFFTWNNV